MHPPVSPGRRLLYGLFGLAVRPAPLVARLKCLLPSSTRSRSVVHVIGDSHAALFSGADSMIDAWPRSVRDPSGRFRAYRLGPALAFNLSELESNARGREKLLATLAYGPVPPRGTVMLCFGEIDCRYHLLRQAELQARDVEDVVSECVSRYADVALEVQAMGFTTCVWAVVPANEVAPGEEDTEYPIRGTARERNDVARTFNDLLASRLEPHGIPVISISDDLVGPDGLPRRSYYMDPVHLSQKAFPLAAEAISARGLGVPGEPRKEAEDRVLDGARVTSAAPRVSVLTPSFNQAAWLPHNLRSVACQTYPHIEHIVMDGGSTDGSVEVLRAAGDSIRWRSEPDGGQSDAVNKAFRESRGDIIGWVNSDDAYVDCRVVEDVVAYFVAHPEVDVVYGHAAQIAQDGTIIWMIWVPWFMRRVLRIVNFIGQPVAFIRRSALSDPMLDTTYHFAMDYELWLRLERQGRRFRRIPRIVAVDRHHAARKGVKIADILRSDLERLAEAHGRGYPRGKRVLSWGFYTWRRFMGVFLIPKIPRDLAFTEVHTSRWAVFRRQALSWGKSWPRDYQ